MNLFRNHRDLTSHGDTVLRAVALDVATAGVIALDPGLAVDRFLRREGGDLIVDGRRYSLDRRVVLFGAGKASLRIAQRVEEICGAAIDEGMVVVRRGEGGPLRSVTLVEADHPVPTEASRRAGDAVLELAGTLGPDDLAICCVTGGSSALLSIPADGVSFGAKRELHELLLRSGAPIAEMNAVRKHVSKIKGGRLAAEIAPAEIINLAVSDVVGDALDLITGPTVPDTTTADDAIKVLRDRDLWNRVDTSIRAHLQSPLSASPDLSDVVLRTTMLITGDAACDAMVEAAATRGYGGHVLSTRLDTEAADTGRLVALAARECRATAVPLEPPCVLFGCGGESTVTLGLGGAVQGEGGPNQEVALAAALALEPGDPIAILAMDTDGSDGGTDYAGALTDGETVRRAAETGASVHEHLVAHTSGRLLRELGDVLVTGPTGTNVSDLIVVVVGK